MYRRGANYQTRHFCNDAASAVCDAISTNLISDLAEETNSVSWFALVLIILEPSLTFSVSTIHGGIKGGKNFLIATNNGLQNGRKVDNYWS